MSEQSQTDFIRNVKSLNELISKGDTIKAMEIFYADSVTMQENEDAPRAGKELCIGHERKMLKRVTANTSKLINQAIDTDNNIVFGEWEHSFTTGDNKIMKLREVSIQHWNDSQIIKEKFYYKEYLKDTTGTV